MTKYAGLISNFTRTEVDQLFNLSTARARTKYYTLLAAPRSKPYARILIITSKKLGSAVMRNRIRRRVRSIFYQEKWYEQSHDIAFIARKPVVDLSFEQLKAHVCAHMSPAH